MRKRRRRWGSSQSTEQQIGMNPRHACIPGAGKVHHAERPNFPIHHRAEDDRRIDLRMLVLSTSILDESSLHKTSLFLSQELIRLRSWKVDNDEVRRDGSHHCDSALDNEDPAPA